MASARTVYLGGIGSSVTADDVAAIAAGVPVQLDSAALDRLKKESPPPKSFQPLTQPPEPLGPEDDPSPPLSTRHARATITLKLLELLHGKSKARPALASYLGDLLNTLPALRLPSVSDAVALRALSCACMGVGTVDSGAQLDAALVAAQQQPPGISQGEAIALDAGRAPGGGVACCALVSSRATLSAATVIAALTAEALKADV